VQTISKLSDKCKKCQHVNDCDDKRMMACSIAESSQPNSVGLSNIMPMTQPLARKHTPITINIGENGTINTSMEEIAEKIKKNLYKNLNCSFNK